jgi:hypothetical protein
MSTKDRKWYEKPLRIAALKGGTGKRPLVKVPYILSKIGFNTEQSPRRHGGTMDSLEISQDNKGAFRNAKVEIYR